MELSGNREVCMAHLPYVRFSVGALGTWHLHKGCQLDDLQPLSNSKLGPQKDLQYQKQASSMGAKRQLQSAVCL